MNALARRGCTILLAATLSLVPTASGAEAEDGAGEGHHPLHVFLFYVPNRIFDTLDVFRARVRVGPGIAVGARATEVADVFLGTYTTLYTGIPGPRGKPVPSLPIGFEANHGLEVSVADASTGLGFAPEYGLLEVGAGAQAVLVGFDLGVDPLELLDLLVGIVGLDIVGDDL